MAVAERLGLLDRTVRYPITDVVTIDVPLFRSENRWDRRDVLEYDPLLIDDLVEAVQAARAPVTLVDCGADIGLVAVLVSARCHGRIARIIALEPNDVAYPVLQTNMSRLPVKAEALAVAVADFRGRGRLEAPAYNASDHAKYVVPAVDGDFDVVRVDDLGIEPDGTLVLKIDVEGYELAALRGAEESLHRAADFVVSFEAHPEVSQRTGTEPADVISFLQTIRRCAVSVSDVPGLVLASDRPFFPQIPALRSMGYNVLCRSLPE